MLGNGTPEELLKYVDAWFDELDMGMFDDDQVQRVVHHLRTRGFTSAECLRKLAVLLDEECYCESWISLSNVCRAASELEPTSSLMFHTWGFCGMNWLDAGWPGHRRSELKAIARESEEAFAKAIHLDPNDADLHYNFGVFYYMHREEFDNELEVVEKVAELLKKAIEIDNRHALARLYLGHWYHDNAQWADAILYYESVDQNDLEEQLHAWRVYRLRGQIAACQAFVGDLEMSRRNFSALLNDMARLNDEEFDDVADLIDLDEASAAISGPLADAELEQGLNTILRRLGLEPGDLSKDAGSIARSLIMNWSGGNGCRTPEKGDRDRQ